jgi:HAD superfamily hydrolase (TIGR01509 family)
MAGTLMVRLLSREIGCEVGEDQVKQIEKWHQEAYRRLAPTVRPLRGARELLQCLSRKGVPWAIATSSEKETAEPTLQKIGVEADAPNVVTRDDVDAAKPDPDLFLTAAKCIKADLDQSVAFGDSVWDMIAARRARVLGVGLLTGGYARDELERAGAFRVYHDPADLLLHVEEVGVE